MCKKGFLRGLKYHFSGKLHGFVKIIKILQTQIYLGPVAKFQCTAWLGGPWLGGQLAPGAGFCRQNLGIKYIPCLGSRYPLMDNNGCQIY